MGKHWNLSKEALKNHIGFARGNQINKGRFPSEVTKSKMASSQRRTYKEGRISATKGKIPWNKGKIGFSAWNKGLKGFLAGEKSPHWKLDRTKLMRYNDDSKDRRSYAYANWRKEVWRRDNFKCRISNNDCNGKIEAHHILGWRSHPELRYETNNGITLCQAHYPRKRAEEKRLIPFFNELVSVSKV